MKRTILFLAAAAAFMVSRPAVADTGDDPADTETSEAQKAADDALAQKADAPGHTHVLPTTASDRAKAVAFGKQGEAMRTAHSQADKHGKKDADDAHGDAANRAAHGAAMSAAGSANADEHAAAGQARASDARSHHSMPNTTPGSSTAPTTMPGKH